MKRLALSIAAAAALSAPALAQDAAMQSDQDELIPMFLVSSDELLGAEVYWADGSSAGDIVDYETEDGDVTSLLVHDMMPEDSIISRYRIVGDDVVGYDEEDRTVVLRLSEDDYQSPY